MNIVILGAGTVGTSIAELLCQDGQNVTLVDSNRDVLDAVEEKLDLQTICGSACDAVTLFQAGVQSAELCLCVTNSDETNLIGSSMAKSMGARRSVARIYNPAFRDNSTFDYRLHFGIDRLLSLEHLTALEIAKRIRKQGLFAVDYFARGGIEVIEVAVEKDSQIVGIPLREMKIPAGVRVGLIASEGKTIIPGADDVLQIGDHATLIGGLEKIERVRKMFEHRFPPKLNVVIAGGGEIGYHLALLLETGRFNVTLMEADAERCAYLAERLAKVTVLHADITRRSEMEEARVGKADVFVATTGRDEDNIVCGVEARELGSQRIIGIIRRPDYANVVEKLGIDVAVSPREVMAAQIRGMVNAGPIIARSFIAGGDAEVWEVDILKGAPVTRSPLKDLHFDGALVAALVHGDLAKVPKADDLMKPGETAVMIVEHSRKAEILQMFEPE